MTVRFPLVVYDNVEPVLQLGEAPQIQVDLINQSAAWAYGNSTLGPSAKLEVNTANGTLLSGQPFVDTYYIAGAYRTRVDRFSTEAETPNISMVTDNYNRIRVNYDSVSLPTGDANNLQYPLYLDGSYNLRAMSRQDFLDTFVYPALDALQIWDGSTTYLQQGTYFLTTSASPANATLVSSTPVATNSVANISAYTSSGIPEATKQTTDTNYYLAKVDYPPTSFPFYDADLGRYDLPIYLDAGTEQLYQHTPQSWANLLGPFLRYYLATPGSGYEISYSMASGNQRGSTYTDTRVTPTGTGYTTRYVNTNDYRTQEFPTGTASTITENTKRFYINRGSPPPPASSVDSFPTLPLSSWGTEDRELYNSAQGSLTQAFCKMTITNEFNSNSRIKVDGVSWTNASTATVNTGYIDITGYTSPTIEVRYFQTNPSRVGAGYTTDESAGGSSVSGTWYTLANGAGREFRWLSESITPSTGQDFGQVSATGVYFEVRITDSGSAPTVSRASVTRDVLLRTVASRDMPE